MKLQETLEHLNFSRLEAQIYMALIGSEPMSAYQLAKKSQLHALLFTMRWSTC